MKSSATVRRPVARMAGERGFAMLIVFVFAAAVALMLYQQVPRVAFETQRDKEMLLIERGAQFQRAIQLYYVAYKKWPSKLEDLENTNQKRYLRRRYVDPMTGKDEWRLVHTNGVPLQPGQPGYPGVGQQGIGQQGQVQINPNFNPQFPGAQTNPNGQVIGPNGQVVNGLAVGNNGLPFNPGQQQFQIGPNGQPVAINSQTGQPINSQNGGVSVVPSFPGQFPGVNSTGAPGVVQGGGQPGVAPHQAVNLIHNIVTQPRPAPRIPNTSLNGPIPNGGVGLAGVDHKKEGPIILINGERQKYN